MLIYKNVRYNQNMLVYYGSMCRIRWCVVWTLHVDNWGLAQMNIKNIFILKGDYTAIKNFLVLLWPTFLASSLIFLNLIFGIFIASKDEGGVALLYYSDVWYVVRRDTR